MNMKRHKAINSLPKPKVKNESIQLANIKPSEKGITFSFAYLDHDIKLFNLGGRESDGTVGGKWFLRLLDCLKNVSGETIPELQKSRVYQLHPVNWTTANTKPPLNLSQAEFWQFRIDKSHGRIIGVIADYVFYVIWLDPHHNLTNSEGYGGICAFPDPKY